MTFEPFLARLQSVGSILLARVEIGKELTAPEKANKTANRLMTIPGVGPVTFSGITAAILDAQRLRQRAPVPSA